MFEKYPLIVSRYEELSEAIVQPDIIADTARYQAYLKERAALEEQVTAWQRLCFGTVRTSQYRLPYSLRI